MADVVLNAGLGGATATSTLGPTFKTFYNKQLLVNAREELVYAQFAKKYPLPKGQGKTMEWRRSTPYATVSTPLIEGVNPDAGGHEITSQTVTVDQYGYFVKGTDVVKHISFDPLLDEVSKELGAQAGQSIDEITRDVMVAGSSVYYAAGNTARNQIVDADVLAANDLIAVRATLVDNLAKPFRGSSYVAVIHPLTHADLMRDSTIRAAMNAGDHRSELFKGEIGEFAGIAFVETGIAKVFEDAGAGGTVNVYATMVYGKDACGMTELSGLGMEMIYHAIGTSGVADPLNRFWTSGWKTSTVTKRLREEFMIRIEHGCTNG